MRIAGRLALLTLLPAAVSVQAQRRAPRAGGPRPVPVTGAVGSVDLEQRTIQVISKWIQVFPVRRR